jgi:predicted cobalt transporter CbtA
VPPVGTKAEDAVGEAEPEEDDEDDDEESAWSPAEGWLRAASTSAGDESGLGVAVFEYAAE